MSTKRSQEKAIGIEELKLEIIELENRSVELEPKERRRLSRLRHKLEQAEEKEKAHQVQQEKDTLFMREAIKEAKKAAKLGEVPIGCVIVRDDKVIARGYNRRNTDHSTLSHAEITAIKKASNKLKDWRLSDCTLYVTLEPCQMCAGAIIQARLSRVVMGCMNPKAGCGGSILNILEMKEFNHQAEVIRGVEKEECARILQDFFKELRDGGTKGAD